VVTPRVGDWQGSYVTEGLELLEVADLSKLRARIHVSEYELYRIKAGSQASIEVRGRIGKWDARTAYVSARPVEMDVRLRDEKEASAANPLHYYLVDLEIDNPRTELRPGMQGVARVYGGRRSLAGLAAESIRNFSGRKLW
jgi:HlyD family secretion protein